MARIYNQESYEGSFNPSQQSRGFNAVSAVDTSSQERGRMQQQLQDIDTQTKSLTRQQNLDTGILRAQHSIEKANQQARAKTLSGIIQLSQTALKGVTMVAEENEAQREYEAQLDAYFDEPLNDYSLGSQSPKLTEAEESSNDFNNKQIAIGQATVDAAGGDAQVQSDLHLEAQKQGRAVNVQRQNAYQASQSVGSFLNNFMDSDVVITRPDKSTFTPATAETDADLRAALALGSREFARGAGLEKMNRAAVQRALIPAVVNARNSILSIRGKAIKTAQEQATLDEVNGAVIDGIIDGTENPAQLFENAFAGLVGVGGRTKGMASKDALTGVLEAIVNEGDLKDFEALEKHVTATGHQLGKGVTGQQIRDAKNEFLDRVHNDGVRENRAKAKTLNSYKEDRYRELIEAGADSDRIRAVEEKYIGLARELGGNDALAFEKSIMAGGTSDSTVAFGLLMDQAQDGELTPEDMRNAFDSGVISSNQLTQLDAIVGKEARELDAKMQPFAKEITRASKYVVEKGLNSELSMMGETSSATASQEADIGRTITQRVREFIARNPDAGPGVISDFTQKTRDNILADIAAEKKAADDGKYEWKYRYLATPSLNAAKGRKAISETTGRTVRDFRQLSTYDLQQAKFNNKDDDKTNDINPSADILFDRKDILQYAELYRQGGEAALPDRVKVVAGAVGGMSPRVLIEQQAQAHAIKVDLKDYIRQEQAKGLNAADLPKPERLEQEALDVIGHYESDSAGGYDAVNQYGGPGGLSTGADRGFYSGPFSQMPQHGGRRLTDMTIQEIMDLQYDDPNVSMEQWRVQGRLHAVGRYQFVGDTLAGIVRNSGIDPNTRFSPEVQDALALYHLRTSSGLSQWVGPSKPESQGGATAREREIVRYARIMESGKASKAQLLRISRMFM